MVLVVSPAPARRRVDPLRRVLDVVCLAILAGAIWAGFRLGRLVRHWRS